MPRPADNHRHRTKYCYLRPCKGTRVSGGKITRHLREVHLLSESQVRRWTTLFKEVIKDVIYPDIIQEALPWTRSRSCKSKPSHFLFTNDAGGTFSQSALSVESSRTAGPLPSSKHYEALSGAWSEDLSSKSLPSHAPDLGRESARDALQQNLSRKRDTKERDRKIVKLKQTIKRMKLELRSVVAHNKHLLHLLSKKPKRSHAREQMVRSLVTRMGWRSKSRAGSEDRGQLTGEDDAINFSEDQDDLGEECSESLSSTPDSWDFEKVRLTVSQVAPNVSQDTAADQRASPRH